MHIYLVRHGETDWNKIGIVQGRTDIPLNEEGRKQARDAQTIYEGKEFDALITSPLSRAKETGLILTQKAIVKTIREDERVIERNYGPTEGILIKEREKRYGSGYVEGQETRKAVHERMEQALKEYASTYENDVLVVCHGGVIGNFLRIHFKEFEDLKFKIGNCSLTVLDGTDLSVLAFNLSDQEAYAWVRTHSS